MKLHTDDMNEAYYNLTPETILQAAELAGLEPTGHILRLNSLENRVYSLYLEDGTQAVIKIYRPGRWSRECILEEHAFTRELAAGEIPVCVPIEFNGSTLGDINGFAYALWPKTGGRIPDDFTETDMVSIGRLIARIHNCGRRTPAKHRVTLSAETFLTEPLRWLIDTNALPGNLTGRFTDACEIIANTYRERSAGVPMHRIHGDCHWGNLLKRDENFFILDFDDFVTGPAVQDIWMLAPATDAASTELRTALLAGYTEFAAFDPAWLGLAEPLRGMRFVHYAAWIARRYTDPAFKDAFPHFGTADYWERETIDLEKIAASCQGKAEQQLLEDSDYFWDMST
jgi:Ser/Thr protein kinase RdoA (MazF antagonist)